MHHQHSLSSSSLSWHPKNLCCCCCCCAISASSSTSSWLHAKIVHCSHGDLLYTCTNNNALKVIFAAAEQPSIRPWNLPIKRRANNPDFRTRSLQCQLLLHSKLNPTSVSAKTAWTKNEEIQLLTRGVGAGGEANKK